MKKESPVKYEARDGMGVLTAVGWDGCFLKFPSIPFLREKLREGNFRSFVFFVGRQNFALTALSILRRSFCLFELIMDDTSV